MPGFRYPHWRSLVAGIVAGGLGVGGAFYAGGGVQGGLHGVYPSLSDLEIGDLKHTTDFRSVYGSVLQGWLGAPADRILGGSFPNLPLAA